MWDIQLDRSGETSLQRQLYQTLKDGILSGRLKAGEALPSTRELSAELGVSRNTVGAAYDMLWTEGYMISRQGAPSRVAEGLLLHSAGKAEAKRDASPDKPKILWISGRGSPICLISRGSNGTTV